METEVPFTANDQITPEEESAPISIRKLDRLETTSPSQGASN